MQVQDFVDSKDAVWEVIDADASPLREDDTEALGELDAVTLTL